ncbi:enoyl-CoA hydratase/isomerase family protein [Undibacterium sp. Jales W-56]|uniref:enoyl-CoA hydratase/isomerase family protein n=1 Tax=Undibacterium sp. Jales W-56 TaxID=2897325 RepID=UPI0021D1AD6B|nr:enoyl-CoA hydratase/isomerase family protein [Undibacterium sp. Jales W-56]MCU6433296.1 enoyl-CoA hydratase/isomerase family protein [Undibacterium sp. Jales W-56]
MTVRYTLDAQGVATLSLTQPVALHDVMQVLEQAVNDESVQGILLLASTGDFVTDEVKFAASNNAASNNTAANNAALGKAAVLFAKTEERHRSLRKLENCGKPLAIALSLGAAGLSLELAMVAHHRVAADIAVAEFCMSEIGSGRMPGLGGTQRLPRLIGIQNALSMLLENKKLHAAEALALNLVDALVPAGAEANEARLWLLSKLVQASIVQQPWDRKGYKIPGGAVASPAMQQLFMLSNAMLRAKNRASEKAAVNTLSSVYEGLITDIDTGLKTEARYFVNAVI